MLADQVKAGKLPPVDQRLPETPYVDPLPKSASTAACGTAASSARPTATA